MKSIPLHEFQIEKFLCILNQMLAIIFVGIVVEGSFITSFVEKISGLLEIA